MNCELQINDKEMFDKFKLTRLTPSQPAIDMRAYKACRLSSWTLLKHVRLSNLALFEEAGYLETDILNLVMKMNQYGTLEPCLTMVQFVEIADMS